MFNAAHQCLHVHSSTVITQMVDWNKQELYSGLRMLYGL